MGGLQALGGLLDRDSPGPPAWSPEVWCKMGVRVSLPAPPCPPSLGCEAVLGEGPVLCMPQFLLMPPGCQVYGVVILTVGVISTAGATP